MELAKKGEAGPHMIGVWKILDVMMGASQTQGPSLGLVEYVFLEGKIIKWIWFDLNQFHCIRNIQSIFFPPRFPPFDNRYSLFLKHAIFVIRDGSVWLPHPLLDPRIQPPRPRLGDWSCPSGDRGPLPLETPSWFPKVPLPLLPWFLMTWFHVYIPHFLSTIWR